MANTPVENSAPQSNGNLLPDNVLRVIAYFLSAKEPAVWPTPSAPPLALPPERYHLTRLLCASKHLRELLSNDVVFKVHFNTNFGELLFLVGNTPDTGKWQVNNTNKMDWTKGGVWQINKRMLQGAGPVEYKYVMVDKAGAVHWWEKDPNHALNVCSPFHPAVTKSMSKYSYTPAITSSVPSDNVSVLYNCRDRSFLFSADYEIKGWSQDLAFAFTLQPSHNARIKTLAATHGAHVLFSTDEDALLRVTDLNTLQIIHDQWLERWIIATWINDADNLLYILSNWEVKIFDRRSLKVVQRIPCDYDLKDTSFNSAFLVTGDHTLYIGSSMRFDQPLVIGGHKALRQYDLRRSESCVRFVESDRSIKHLVKSADKSQDVFTTTWKHHDKEPNCIELFDPTKFSLKALGDVNEVVTSLKVGNENQLVWGGSSGASIFYTDGDGHIEKLVANAPVSAIEFGENDSTLYTSAPKAANGEPAVITKWTSARKPQV